MKVGRDSESQRTQKKTYSTSVKQLVTKEYYSFYTLLLFSDRFYIL